MLYTTCVCVCVNLGAVDCGQEHLKKKKSQHRPLLHHQFKGAIFHTKESFEERKDGGQKKETDFQMCCKEKQTLGSSLLSLLSSSFLCSYRKEQNDCGAQLGGRVTE